MVYCLKRPSMIFPCAPRISFPDPFSPLLHFSISFTFQWHSPSTPFSFYVCTYFSGLVGRPYMGGYISAQLWYCGRCLFISANPHFWRVVSFYKDLTFSRFCYPSISTCGLCVATFSSRARVAGNESWLKKNTNYSTAPPHIIPWNWGSKNKQDHLWMNIAPDINIQRSS